MNEDITGLKSIQEEEQGVEPEALTDITGLTPVSATDDPAFADPAKLASLRSSQDLETAAAVSGDPVSSVQTTHFLDPVKVREAQALAKEFGIEPSEAMENSEIYKNNRDVRAAIELANRKGGMGEYIYPTYRKLFSDSAYAAANKDQAKALSKLEMAARGIRQRDEGVIAQSLRAVSVFGVGLAEMALDLPRTLPEVAKGVAAGAILLTNKKLNLDREAKGLPLLPEPELSFLAGDSERSEVTKAVKEFKEIISPIASDSGIFDQIKSGNWGGAAVSLATNIAETAPLIAAMAATGGASLYALGAYSAMQSFTEGLDEGKAFNPNPTLRPYVPLPTLNYSPVNGVAPLDTRPAPYSLVSKGAMTAAEKFKAVGVSGAKGLAEAGGEMVTLGIMRSSFNQTIKLISGKVAKKEFAKTFLKEGLFATLQEGGSETGTSVAQRTIDYLAQDNLDDTEVIFGNEAINDYVSSGLVGGVVGGTMSGAGTLFSVKKRIREAREQQLTDKRLSQVMASVKLENIEGAADLVDATLEEMGAPESVHLDLEAVETFFQDKPEEGDSFLGDHFTKEEIEEARRTGKSLTMRRGKWITEVANTPTGEGLLGDVMYSEGGVKASETAKHTKEAIALAKAEKARKKEEAFNKQTPVQLQEFREQLIKPKRNGGFGRKAAEVDGVISIIDAWADISAKEAGIDKATWLEQKNIKLNIGKEAMTSNDGAKGATTFLDGSTVIDLYENAELSTLIHELGHVFIKDLEIMSKAELGGEGARSAMAVLDEAFGDDVEAKTRAFEQYIKEGKAPSTKLRTAFEHFAKWLTSIYKHLKGSNIAEISDEVRGMFDLRLATEAQIEEASMYYLKKDKLSALLKGDSKLAAKLTAAEKSAFENRMKKLLKTQARTSAKQAELKAETRKEMDNVPVYAFYEALAQAGGYTVEELESYGADIDALKKNHRRVIGVEKQARTARHLAREHGYINADTLSVSEKEFIKENKLGHLTRKTRKKGSLVKETQDQQPLSKQKKEGVPLDILVKELVDMNKISVPSERNETDYFLEMLAKDEALEGNMLVEKPALEDAAAYSGYDSVELALSDLGESMPRAKAIAARVEEKTKAIEAGVADKYLKSAMKGELDVHDNASQSLILAELAKAEKEAGVRGRGRDTVAAAKEAILNKPVHEARSYLNFSKTERAEAVKADEAYQRGDARQAAVHKEKQFNSHVMVTEAIKVNELVDRMKDKYDGIALNKLNKSNSKVENTYAQIIKTISYIYGFTTSDNMFDPNIQDLYMLKEGKGADEALFAEMPEWLVKFEQPKPKKGREQFNYTDLTYGQLIELDEALSALTVVGRDASIALDEAGLKSTSETIAEIKRTSDRLKDKPLLEKHSVIKGGLLKLRGLLKTLKQAKFVAARLDGDRARNDGKIGAAGKLVEGIKEADSAYATLMATLGREAAPHLKVLKEFLTRMPNLMDKANGVPLPKEFRRDNQTKWTPDHLIGVALYMGTAINKDSLMNGYKLRNEDLHSIMSLFTEAELNAIQGLWNVNATLFPIVNEAHYKIYNRHLVKEEAQPFAVEVKGEDGKMKVVQMKGGYHSLKFDSRISFDAEIKQGRQEAEDALETFTTRNGILHRGKLNKTFTFGKFGGSNLPPLLSMQTFYRHLSDASRYTTHEGITRATGKIIRDPRLIEIIEKKEGKDGYAVLRSAFDFAVTGRRQNVSRGWDEMRKLGTISILGLQAGTALKQKSSLVNAANVIGWEWVIKGMMEVGAIGSLTGVSVNDVFNEIMEKDPVMRARDSSGFERDLADMQRTFATKPGLVEKVGQSMGINIKLTPDMLGSFSMAFIRFADRSTAMPVWIGAYKKYLSDFATGDIAADEQAAIKYASQVVSKTQPSTTSMDLSQFQRSEGFTRLLGMFMTWTLLAHNRQRAEFRAWRDGDISFYELSTSMLHEVVLAPFTAAMLGGIGTGSILALFGDDEEKKEEFISSVFTDMVTYPLSGVPIARDFVSAFRFSRDFGETPALDPVRIPLDTIKAFHAYATNPNKDIKRASTLLFKSLGIGIQLPVHNIVKTGKKWHQNLKK